MLKNFNFQELAYLTRVIREDVLKTINCHQVAIVHFFNSDDLTITAQITTKRLLDIKPDGSKIWKEYPLFTDVPIVILGGNDSLLTFPVLAGQECLLLFNDRELDEWWANGGINSFNAERYHSFSDAIALIGLRSQATKFSNYDNNSVTLQYNTNNKIFINDNGVNMNCDIVTTGNLTVGGNLYVTGSSIIDGGTW
jgi:Phage protein Gp138 N-terminal domain